MIKLTFCLHRSPHLSREEFQLYWFEKHAPLVALHRHALRIERYVQMHSMTAEIYDVIRDGRGAPGMFGGAAQLWWASLQDLQTAMASSEGQRAGLELLDDER